MSAFLGQSKVRGLAQQGFEAGLDKVVIVGQGGCDALGFHDVETGAVGEAPVFVGALFVAIKGDCKLFRRLWNYDYGIAPAKALDRTDHSPALPWITAAYAIQELDEDHFAGH